MVFFWENHLAKVFRLFIAYFFIIFCLKLLLFLYFKKAFFIKDDTSSEAFLYHRIGVLCAKEIHRLGPMDLKLFYSLESRVFDFRLYFFSLQSETKRTEIRFVCVSLVRFAVLASFFSQYSLIFA
jgi:hypothetical protein